MRDLKTRICDTISAFSRGSLREIALQFFRVLGYQSDRIPALDGKSDFLELYEAKGKLTNAQRALFDAWSDVKLLFQFTEDELRAHYGLFRLPQFEPSRAESFLFLAVDLTERDYTRGWLANMTRAVNRPFAMPVVVLYRYKQYTGNVVVTVGVVHRRPNRRDPTRDVLERVTLVKDIRAQSPHRAHLEALAGLSLNGLVRDHHARSFDQLHEAWEQALDTEPLNRRFYSELFRWFERAVNEAAWPPAAPREQQVIRCITRMLFVWFIKEKGLVAADWFARDQMDEMLVEFGGSDYYRAVLQNLFFATLNTPSEHRAWSTRTHNSDRAFSRWRYRSLIGDSDRFEALMAQTPFINGGLFDCLDDEDSDREGGGRIDMFTDPDPADGVHAERARRRAWNFLNVPDRLFFDEHGLLALFGRFKFTVEENTPAETEVALDPELLGKVFEHLLASYNPETRDTARKQTGSYYTPRPVVDYMVDEALVTALAEKVKPRDGDANVWRDRLRYLLDYEDAGELFEKDDAEEVVRGISTLKVLDPAVGSGAFPMAMLNKLTLALRRLDPKNKLWKQLQKEAATKRSNAAFETHDQAARDAQLLEISDIFARYTGDFGRKVYLIQNSIFGVDIQAIACQIAKLRFFISLAIEQKPDPVAENFGIKPLPNLETRFVAADALLELQRDRTLSSASDRVREIEKHLLANRERHFHANSREAKVDCMDNDRRLRTQLATELEAVGFPSDTAKQIAHWDPYDQNDVAQWFDSEYMFGINEGFDVVIGNPPYIQLQKDHGRLGNRYASVGYKSYMRTGDIYQLFFEKGCRLLRSRGTLAYITSNSWLRAKYGGPLREYFIRRHTPLRLLDMGKDVFDAVVDASVLILRSGGSGIPFPGVDTDRVGEMEFPPPRERWGEVRPRGRTPWSILTDVEWRVMEKMHSRGKPLRDWDDISIYRGILTGYNRAFLVDERLRTQLIAEDAKSSEILKPILRGRDIQRYRARWDDRWLIATLPSLNIDIDEYPAVKRHLLSYGRTRLAQTGQRLPDGRKARKHTPHRWFELQDTCAYHGEFSKQKLFWMDMSPIGRFAYSDVEMYCNDKAYVMTGSSLKWLCAILNSTLVTWMIQRTARTTGAGLTQWQKFVVETIPVPVMDPSLELPVVSAVDQIFRSKKFDSLVDTSELEAHLDQLIYRLYGLTAMEIQAVNASRAR